MRQFANRVNVHIQTNKMAELMASADLAIGAAGFTSWERAWLGLPAIVFTVAANQQRNAAALEQSGAGIYLGSSSEIDKSKLAFTTKYLSSDVKALSSISSKAIALSGPAGSFGTDKVVERLNSLVEGIA
jgi:UDP-2,4-diacetamido-2,4,6-trideoxy-beta-L-altropyranose hydrolase